MITQSIQSFVVLFSTLFKETLVLQESTDIASTISLVVSGLEYARRPNRLFLQSYIYIIYYTIILIRCKQNYHTTLYYTQRDALLASFSTYVHFLDFVLE